MTRLELQHFLETIPGLRKVYFQPPTNIRMEYPCIRYKLEGIPKVHADNKLYLMNGKYNLTLIDHDPDSCIVNKVMQLPYCSFDNFYASDNLNHWVFTLYINNKEDKHNGR